MEKWIILILCATMVAALEITGISGSLEEGSVISITGTDFSQNNAIGNVHWLGDLIDSSAAGTVPSDTDVWKFRLSGTTYSPIISTNYAHSGDKSFFIDTDTIYRGFWYDHGEGMGEMYASWWVLLPDTGYTGQWKMMRITTHGLITDDDGEICLFNFMLSAGGGNQVHIRPCTEENNNYNVYPGQDCTSPHSYSGAPNYAWPDEGLDHMKWVRMEAYLKESAPDSWDGIVQTRITRPEAASNKIVTTNFANQMTRTDSQMKQYINWQNYYSGGQDFYIDDVYVQVGSSARIEIGNMPTYADSNHIEIQPFNTWSDISISFDLNLGSFSENDNIYLYVIKSDGSVNVNGYLLDLSETCTPAEEICGNGIDEDCDGKDLPCNSDGECPTTYPEGMVACTGFEQWTGDADTAPDYPFGLYSDESHWQDHVDRTEVLANCNGWAAESGNYFFYGNWFSEYDSCLGNTGGSPRISLGGFGDYGNGLGFYFSDFNSDELYLKFQVRLGDGWKTNTNHMVKFIRPKWAGGGYADFYSNVIMYEGSSNRVYAPGVGESLWTEGFDLGTIGIDLSDGLWHEFALYEDISNLRTANPNSIDVVIWVDGQEIISRHVPTNADYILQYGNIGFDRIALLENFCGTQNDGTVTYAYDDLEIWDRLPGSEPMTLQELISIMDMWKAGQRTIQQVMEAIQTWKSG